MDMIPRAPLQETPVAPAEVSSPISSKPRTVRVFWILICISIAVGVILPIVPNWRALSNSYALTAAGPSFFAHLLLFLLAIWAVYGKRNWVRFAVGLFIVGSVLVHSQTLLLPFANPQFIVMWLESVSTIASSNPSGLLSALGKPAGLLLQVLSLGFLFSPSANRWFVPPESQRPEGSLPAGEMNRIWSKEISSLNHGTLITSLILVFGIDLAILVASPSLWMFWVAMLVVLLIFLAFYSVEQLVFRKHFLSSTSQYDSWILFLIGLRNFVCILGLIPFIQILGGAVLVYGGLPYLLIYGIVIWLRWKQVP